MNNVTTKILLIIEILLATIIAGMAIIVIVLGTSVRARNEVLELRENGEATWYEIPIKLRRDYVPTDAVYELRIKKFIRGSRMIDSFFDNNEELVKNALFMVNGKAQYMLEKHLEENNPFETKDKRIDVPFNSIEVTKISQELWKATWRERTYDKNGKIIMEEDYKAVFHMELLEIPAGKGYDTVRQYNPFGIYINDYDIDLLRKLM